MEKNTYYISVGSREISKVMTASPFELEIVASDDEISQLRKLFDNMYSADWGGFFRAHIPYIPYHFDSSNDMIDQNLHKAYQMLYDLGTEETRTHIGSMGLLASNNDHSII